MQKSIEKIVARPAQPGMVGDGFRVFNFIPGIISQKRIDPFLMMDFNAAYDFGASEHIRGVDVHPHKGFETITIAYQGSVAHNDSKGNSGVIHPGDVQWMTAGGGILHKEYHEENFARKGGNFEMVQLWVNLPQKFKSVEAHYQAITQSEMKRVILPDEGGVVNIIAGEFNNVKGSAHTYSPINLFDLKLNKGARVKTSIPATYNTAALVVNGSADFNGEPAGQHSFVLFANNGEDIEIEVTENAVILLLGGAPLNEPIASYGPFVMNTQEEIITAINDFNSGKFGTVK